MILVNYLSIFFDIQLNYPEPIQIICIQELWVGHSMYHGILYVLVYFLHKYKVVCITIVLTLDILTCFKIITENRFWFIYALD